MDVTRRGPDAFRHLVDALTETGCWHLVRDLEPGSLPALPTRAPPHPVSKSNDSEFLSIPEAKKKGTASANATDKKPLDAPPLLMPSDFPDKDIPKFNVIKSTTFMEDNGKDRKLYRTRGRRRGVLVVFSYVQFASELEDYRLGVDTDCQMLKYLFSEFGFEVISFLNLTKQETLTHMQHLPLEGVESVFIVVSSHGYERAGSWETDIRCSDGGLLSTLDVVDRFNNTNCPALIGIPKVFIFQMCRGDNRSALRPLVTGTTTDGAPFRDPPRARARPPRPPRIYSDILIAHSTLPGYVSHRNMDSGSWYIQALCAVFAARAHDCHVETLFTLVDQALECRFGPQTSDVHKWGFNGKLYLHPGLFED
ncbi:caspase Dronc-like isoform X2 [Choristoneura fumiferana]